MTRQDARFACTGLAAAVAIGLLTGAAMKPQLGLGDRPEGPQMFSFGGGARSTGPFDNGPSLTGYGDNIPQYVTGTDWIADRLAALPPEATVEDEPLEYAEAPPPPARAAWTAPRLEEPPRTEVSFPSTSGGAAYEANLPRPPEPPAADDMVTGDFAPAAEPAN